MPSTALSTIAALLMATSGLGSLAPPRALSAPTKLSSTSGASSGRSAATSPAAKALTTISNAARAPLRNWDSSNDGSAALVAPAPGVLPLPGAAGVSATGVAWPSITGPLAAPGAVKGDGRGGG